jgi:N-acetylneuraminic acid mutarotase
MHYRALCVLVALAAAGTLARSAAPSLGATGWGSTATMGWTYCSMIGAQAGHRIYLIGDRYALHIYDITTNAWSAGGAVPRNQYGPVAAVGGKIYVIGGVYLAGAPILQRPGDSAATLKCEGSNYEATGTRETGDVQAYDPATDSWTYVAALPSPRAGGAAAVLDGKIHLIGGGNYQGQAWDDLENHLVYDPATNAWSSLAPMPSTRVAPALVTDAAGGKIYAIGGWDSSTQNPSGRNEVYDSATNRWTTKPPMPTARSDVGAALLNGLIYVMGGSTSNAPASTVETYDVANHSWASAMPLPARRPMAYALAVKGTLYVTAGNLCQDGTCDGTNRFWTLTSALSERSP